MLIVCKMRTTQCWTEIRNSTYLTLSFVKELAYNQNMNNIHKIFSETSNKILLGGTLFVTLRLIFPVLQCIYKAGTPSWEQACNEASVLFFSFGPNNAYSVHEWRTFTEAIVIAIITGVLYFLVKKEDRIIRQ